MSNEFNKTVTFRISMHQYLTWVEDYPGRGTEFQTQVESKAFTLLAVTGEEEVALTLGESLARKLDADRKGAVWAGGNCRVLSIRVTRMVSGTVPELILQVSASSDSPIGELVREYPNEPTEDEPTEAPDFESVLF